MSYDWSNLHKDTANFVGARLGEIGDGWNAIKNRFPAEANIALGVAGTFTLFNMWQGGGIMRSLGRGLVAVATVLGISVAAKAIADDNEATGKDTPIIPAVTPMGMAIRAARSTILDTEAGQEIDLETNTEAPLNAIPTLGEVNVGRDTRPASTSQNAASAWPEMTRKRIAGDHDVLVIEGQLTQAQIAFIADIDPNDNFNRDSKPRHFNGNAVGALTPNTPFIQNAQGQQLKLKDETMDKLQGRN